MAREPIFTYKGKSFTSALNKVDRDKLYGWTEVKYKDQNGQLCSYINMLDDGKTMVGSGGLSLKSIDEKGEEVDKAKLVATYLDGSPAVLHPSIFDIETELLDTKDIYEYLNMDVKSVYQLSIKEGLEELIEILKEKTTLYFKFNYRAGYDSDDAFLIHQEQNVFAIIGKIANFSYSSLNTSVQLEDVNEEENTDELDFNLF
ncbi:MAG: hypothetical protein RLZZ546_240 [Bacteroidota bacterium]|jgi:hypothetical protein